MDIEVRARCDRSPKLETCECLPRQWFPLLDSPFNKVKLPPNEGVSHAARTETFQQSETHVLLPLVNNFYRSIYECETEY